MSFLLLSLHFVQKGSLPKILLNNAKNRNSHWFRTVQKRLKSTDKKTSHVEFSKSASYPTKTTLANTIGIPRSMAKKKSFRSAVVTFGLPVTLMLIAFYIFFLSNYDFKAEEQLCEMIPGYEEDMNKIPGYRENMAEHRTMQKRRELARKKNEEQKQE